MMRFKKMAAATAIAGSLAAAVAGFGAGAAQADPDWGPDIPWLPGPDDWFPGLDLRPGPGQIKNAFCPWDPPGHWLGGPHGIPCT